MERPTITIRKHERNGWEAKSIIPLPGIIEKEHIRLSNEAPAPAQLEITTGKHYNGGIRAQAAVVYKTEYGFRCQIGIAGDGDYSRPVTTDAKARCTEKKVQEFHEKALGALEIILADVTAHYGVDPFGEVPAA